MPTKRCCRAAGATLPAARLDKLLMSAHDVHRRNEEGWQALPQSRLGRFPRALPISWPMVLPHPGWSGSGRSSALTSRGATSAGALGVLVCSVTSVAAAVGRFFLPLLRKRPIARS
jgi:hypothetical protein